MRVVRSGDSRQPRVKRVIECRECGCEFEIQSGDQKGLERVSDWRDGDYYKLPCPGCGIIRNVDASLFS